MEADESRPSRVYKLDQSFVYSILEVLDKQRNESPNTFCDVTLIAEGKRFPAHRCLLVAVSDYFRSMFQANHFVESRSQEVELLSITSKALDCVLDMIYGGKLELHEDIVHEVLAAADHLMLQEPKQFCEQFFTDIINAGGEACMKEAIGIRRSAILYDLHDLALRAERVISSNFEIIVDTDEFKDMSMQEVVHFLSSDDLQVSHEVIIWKAALKWTEADIESRREKFDALMEVIRFPLMDAESLVTVGKHPMMSTVTCQEYVREAFEYQLLVKQRSFNQTPRTKPRCTSQNTVIYCFAGRGHFLCFLPHRNDWFSLQSPFDVERRLPQPLPSINRDFSIGLLTASGHVYLRVMSRSREQVSHFALQHLKVYSLATNTWARCALPATVKFAILIECDGTLYSCSRAGIEAYDPEVDAWSQKMAMPLGPCQFAVSDKSCIYLFNHDEGSIEVIHTDRQFLCLKSQLPLLTQFDVLSAAKLDQHDVFITMRNSVGTSRKIFNLRTNQMHDADTIFCNGMPHLPRGSNSLPHWLNGDDHWDVVFDRNKSEIYVLAQWQTMSDLPWGGEPRSSGSSGSAAGGDQPTSKADGVLPFFRVSISCTWKRQACFPEVLLGERYLASAHRSRRNSRWPLLMCISDGQSSMATKIP